MLRIGALIVASALALTGASADAPVRDLDAPLAQTTPAGERWTWPVAGASVARPYLAPATRYASGHRGIDLAASVGVSVVAPTGGVVLFVGRVVDRGVLTLDIGAGRVVTLEPISTTLAVGAVVAAGDPLGAVDVGGHAPTGQLHLGVRVAGEYVDPMRFFGGTPRAILLPCC